MKGKANGLHFFKERNEQAFVNVDTTIGDIV